MIWTRDVVVDWAMRYGAPPIGERLNALQAEGCDRILVIPLYPQYCAASTATVADKAFEALTSMRWQPALRMAAPYYDDPVYIDALARSIRAGLADLDFEPEVVLASYHGIPQAYFDRGDPYYCHCANTTRLLGEALELDEDRLKMTFQSRFGRGEWLKPYTAETLRELASRGVKRVVVVTPGFAADCLETLEEIGVENAGYFREAGGERFAAIPCLNDSAEGIAVIEAVARRELKGWAGYSSGRGPAGFVFALDRLRRRHPEPWPPSARRLVPGARRLIVERRAGQMAAFEHAQGRAVGDFEGIESAAQHERDFVDQHVADGPEFAAKPVAVAQKPRI